MSGAAGSCGEGGGGTLLDRPSPPPPRGRPLSPPAVTPQSAERRRHGGPCGCAAAPLHAGSCSPPRGGCRGCDAGRAAGEKLQLPEWAAQRGGGPTLLAEGAWSGWGRGSGLAEAGGRRAWIGQGGASGGSGGGGVGRAGRPAWSPPRARGHWASTATRRSSRWWSWARPGRVRRGAPAGCGGLRGLRPPTGAPGPLRPRPSAGPGRGSRPVPPRRPGPAAFPRVALRSFAAPLLWVSWPRRHRDGAFPGLPRPPGTRRFPPCPQAASRVLTFVLRR